ncbi:putative mediator of RNA polymerase II transcription subunit 26 [Nymphalis io]|uniref:putative mediator of RNA polymerase II transcription subunit 26 n=1 Tax=Inachis io TaxID=171585 RepID=UPI00216A1132|nr:putative mediator of RNA polymerase II transcription subunit 26 [Nymphalis io]
MIDHQVTLLLIVAVSHASNTGTSKAKQKIQDISRGDKTEKRELEEGNSGIEKRAPLLPSVPSSVATGSVEYADTKESLQDKSPTQQVYATPVPQIAKISDVLTGQGPPFQAAIANHLYSPVSIYQSRPGSPTTYEVSAPVPSQLAYSEHRLSVPNSLQYSAKPQPITKPIITNYEQPQAFVQPSYEHNFLQLQPSYQQSSNNGHLQNAYQQIQYQPQAYNQQQFQYIQEQPLQQPGITYNRQELPIQYQNKPEQRDLKSQPDTTQIQDYNDKQQNALSYARFTFNQGIPSHEQPHVQGSVSPSPQSTSQPETHQQLLQPQPQQYSVQPQPIAQINYQLQHPSQHGPQLQYKSQQQIQQPKLQQIQQQQVQYQAHQAAQQPQLQYQGQHQIQQALQYQQPQIQYQEAQPQPQYVFQQQQLQQLQPFPDLNLQAQPQYQVQPQQYHLPQIQPQLFNVEKSEQVLSKQSVPQRQVFYKQPFQQQLIQPQTQDLGYKNLPVFPTFPPVQYFGKFAQSIFGNYQH